MFNKPLILSGGAGGVAPVHTVDQSIRFNDADNAYMHRTPSSGGNRDTWTWSCWIKRSKITDANATLFQAGDDSDSANYTTILFNGNSGGEPTLKFNSVISSSTKLNLATNQFFRDTSAWYHIVCVYDSGHPIDEERARIYVNGNRVTDLGSTTYPDQNQDSMTNHTVKHSIGRRNQDTSRYMDGYMSEIVLLDGTATTCNSFGEFNSSGIWIPKDVSGLTFGTNGFHIKGQFAGATNPITALGDIQHSTAQSKIGSSSILFDGTNDLLEVGGTSNWYDFGADGNPWTMEAFVRFDTVSITQKLFWQDNTFIGIEYLTGSGIKVRLNNGGINFTASWSPSINTWYHIAVVRQTNNTTTVYIDGTSIGSGTISGGSSSQHKVEIGAYSPSNDEFDGYMDEIRISSVARFTSSFTPTTTEYTADGDTLALIHSNTTNGSTVFKNDVGLGNDSSGNQNNFQTSGLAIHDQVLDSPTNNFPTLNPLNKYGSNVSLSDGNLTSTVSSSSNDRGAKATQAVASGKWYFEVYFSASNADNNGAVAISDSSNYNAIPGETSDPTGFRYGSVGKLKQNGVQGSVITAITAKDIVMVALDMDNNKAWIGINGTFISSGNPATGSNATTTTIPDLAFPASYHYNTTATELFNFGQDSTFSGQNVNANDYSNYVGASDGNSVGSFFYTPPTGYLAICTKNLGS